MSDHCSASLHSIFGSLLSTPFFAPHTCSVCVYNYELFWFYRLNHICILYYFFSFLNIFISVIILCLSFVANKLADKSINDDIDIDADV